MHSRHVIQLSSAAHLEALEGLDPLIESSWTLAAPAVSAQGCERDILQLRCFPLLSVGWPLQAAVRMPDLKYPELAEALCWRIMFLADVSEFPKFTTSKKRKLMKESA